MRETVEQFKKLIGEAFVIHSIQFIPYSLLRSQLLFLPTESLHFFNSLNSIINKITFSFIFTKLSLNYSFLLNFVSWFFLIVLISKTTANIFKYNKILQSIADRHCIYHLWTITFYYIYKYFGYFIIFKTILYFLITHIINLIDINLKVYHWKIIIIF